MAKKSKFHLTQLVHDGYIKDGEVLYFVSDPSKVCSVFKTPAHEFKVKIGNKEETIYSFVQALLGQDPPDHASKWVKNSENQTLYELWQKDLEKDNS